MLNSPYRIGNLGNPAMTTQVPYGYPYPAYPVPTTSANKPAGAGFPPAGTAFPPAGTAFPPAGTAFPPAGTAFPPAGLQTGGLQTGVNVPGQLPMEESYIENILRLNLGKMATIYMTYENNSQWNAKIFKGKLEAAGRDHIIISDPATGMRFLLLMVNLDYITFDEELQYLYPYSGGVPGQQR
ncbi:MULTISPECIES: spore coat protein GerQ [unclassified Paenibacillus]|uniref:spore coat protein GerQ n=1 Tax=unclassified Paenibacillus TaxID=185978 RepID=UPI002787B70F|nr:MULTISPECIES: spore coat protein GerQ [unclassified Paenibacillus]MDQ0901719.1 spore germination protein Q [Paenibacillus sp. V4I7]MDQ0919779.1 spore germination protein Q [Paenibacillus sp. V4I5]